MESTVGAGLLAKNDNAVYLMNTDRSEGGRKPR